MPSTTFSGSQIGSLTPYPYGGDPNGFVTNYTTTVSATASWLLANDNCLVSPFSIDANYRPSTGVTKQALGAVDAAGNPTGKLLFGWGPDSAPRTTMITGALDQAA